jgi:3-oxoacyl-[acyl-carrier protein] reductase
MAANLQGRTALVTGSTKGLGLAIAQVLVDAGASVIVHGREQSAVSAAQARVHADHALAADISTARGCEELIAATAALVGTPDILVNNAGLALEAGPSPDVATFNAALETNAWSGLRLANAFFPAMLERNDHGRLIWISSLAARVPEPTHIPYALSKTAQLFLSASFAYQARHTSVLSVAVLPGLTVTEGAEAFLLRRHQTDAAAAWAAEMPLHPTNLRGTPMRPDEIASMVLFLMSPLAAPFQGRSILMDGGEAPFTLG